MLLEELDGLMFTCGSLLEDLNLPEALKEVYVRDVSCLDPIEKLYYSCNYDPICIHCAAELDASSVDSTIHNVATASRQKCHDINFIIF